MHVYFEFLGEEGRLKPCLKTRGVSGLSNSDPHPGDPTQSDQFSVQAVMIIVLLWWPRGCLLQRCLFLVLPLTGFLHPLHQRHLSLQQGAPAWIPLTVGQCKAVLQNVSRESKLLKFHYSCKRFLWSMAVLSDSPPPSGSGPGLNRDHLQLL